MSESMSRAWNELHEEIRTAVLEFALESMSNVDPPYRLTPDASARYRVALAIRLVEFWETDEGEHHVEDDSRTREKIAEWHARRAAFLLATGRAEKLAADAAFDEASLSAARAIAGLFEADVRRWIKPTASRPPMSSRDVDMLLRRGFDAGRYASAGPLASIDLDSAWGMMGGTGGRDRATFAPRS